MDESDWLRFVSKAWPREIAIGRLSPLLLKVLRADNDRVVLRHDYALKCIHKHGLDFYRLPMMSITLDLGLAVHDDTRPQYLEFYYRDGVLFGHWFKLVVKLTGHAELYATTFFRVSAVDVNRGVKRAHVLREMTGN